MKNVQAMALPLSFAAGVVLIVAGTMASPPLTGVLYLMAVLAGVGSAYFLWGESGRDGVATRLGGKRPWYEAVEQLQNLEPEDADNTAPLDQGRAASGNAPRPPD